MSEYPYLLGFRTDIALGDISKVLASGFLNCM